MRVEQPEGVRGSLKWLQRAVNQRPDLLVLPAIGPVKWLSPLADDGYAEYRDRAFLRLIGEERLADDLAAFWPARGPQWDALGRAGDRIVLVEAKAHISEMLSPPCAAKTGSLSLIEAAFEEVRSALGVSDAAPWTRAFYQIANRLAHLHFLRARGVDACLLLVGFVGDREMSGPEDSAEWRTAYRVAEYAMGLPRGHALSAHVHHLYPDVAALADAPASSAIPTNEPVAVVAPWRVTAVEVIGDSDLKVCFVDGIEGTVHMHDLIWSASPGVFAALRDPELFGRVYLDYGAVTWPGEIDLAPDAMHDEIARNGHWTPQSGRSTD